MIALSHSLPFQDLTAVFDYDELMAEGLPDGSLDGKLLLFRGLIADPQMGAAVLVVQANFFERRLLLECRFAPCGRGWSFFCAHDAGLGTALPAATQCRQFRTRSSNKPGRLGQGYFERALDSKWQPT